MNTYIQRTKAIIENYLEKANRTAAKIAEGRTIYQKEAMDKEETRLRGELAKARKEAEAKIQGIYEEAAAPARNWGKLDGAKLTADAELLKGEGVTPEQFTELVDRYHDNYTMLDRLRKYGEAQNATAAQKAHEKGEHFTLGGPYKVSDIPGPDHKVKEYDSMVKTANHFLNCADGTGFNSDFEKAFAQQTANKDFEAWGAD